MEVSGALELVGGVATRQQLISMTSRAEVDRAVARGGVVVLAVGRYASPDVDDARAAAHALTGVVGLLSAALLHGWAVKTPPVRPHLIVPRGRKVVAAQRARVDLRRADLLPEEVSAGVTTPDRTLVDCGRVLPADESLAVLDSALRSGVDHGHLLRLACRARGPGVRQLRSVARRASPLAANPFESVLRHLTYDVPGLSVRPQVPLWAGADFLGCPDLVDEELRIVVEADSFAWHGGRTALADDARRYNLMVVDGWLVLRFAWEDVMLDPAYVRRILAGAVSERTQRPVRRPRGA